MPTPLCTTRTRWALPPCLIFILIHYKIRQALKPSSNKTQKHTVSHKKGRLKMLHACFQTTFGLKFRCFGVLRLRLALAALIYPTFSTVWQHIIVD
ncbi:hypothetical protein NEISICOT_01258 [Neisseria sicca ATCC 29256]|uniref:Uncharacterized protein n=1 Tax=Neisseria sicca ATCC 29256 TaxID=547045 RepID=C6M415_NEISI|nr:hypothetical protein NEISICOT_01258 [Neisseria sicca ATCC 29256]